ncbi:MAG: hypothetical protein KC912_25435 [Proteobacteria bacterium]|nr:hypothetical protein [Pseudomonadota bacterium]
MEVVSDLDTVGATVHTGEGQWLMGGFAAYGTLFLSIGAAFLGVYFTPSLSEPAFGFLGPIFILVGALPAVLGWAGFSATLRRIEVRLELHEVHVEAFYAGVRVQQFTARLSELQSVELSEQTLRLVGPKVKHVISMKNVEEEDANALAELLGEAVQQREGESRRPPSELLDLVRRRAEAQRT